MTGIIALFIPITAILSITYLLSKLVNVKTGKLNQSEKKELQVVKLENQQLKERIENLEMIVSDVHKIS